MTRLRHLHCSVLQRSPSAPRQARLLLRKLEAFKIAWPEPPLACQRARRRRPVCMPAYQRFTSM